MARRPLHEHRATRTAGGAGAVVLLVAVVISVLEGAAAASAGSGAEFVDSRPIVIASALSGRQVWSVAVFNGDTSPAALTLATAGDPATGAILQVEPPATMTVPPASEAKFIINADGTHLGTDELVLSSSDGTLARREVTVESGPAAPVPDELNFAGWHLVPLTSLVRIAPLTVRTGDPGGGTIGFVGSAQGRLGRVVRTGDRYHVKDVTASGSYSGTAHPSADQATKVTVHVRDAPAWPLIVLVAGLLLVGLLDRFNKRDKPRQQLRVRLAGVQQRARQEQAAARDDLAGLPEPMRPAGVSRITDEGGTRSLLLDSQLVAALGAYDSAIDDAERQRWQPGGDGLAALDGLVRALSALHRQSRLLAEDRAGLMTAMAEENRPPVASSPTFVNVTRLLNPVDVHAETDLSDRASAVHDASDRLARLKHVYDHLVWVSTHDDRGAMREQADRIWQRLLEDDGDLLLIVEEAEGLRRRSDNETRQAPTLHVIVGSQRVSPARIATVQTESDVDLRTVDGGSGDRTPAAGSPPAAPPDVADAGPSASSPVAASGAAPDRPRSPPRRRVSRRLVSAMAVVAVLLAVAGLADLGRGSRLRTPASGGGGATTTLPALPETDEPPPAPVTLPPAAAPVVGSDGPSLLGLIVLGGLAPLLGACLVVALATAGWREWSRRHDRPPPAGLTSLTTGLLRDQRRFDRLSALLVILTGLSVLYFPNPSFGSLGDYAAILLWGSGVGEGIQLARRLIPALPS